MERLLVLADIHSGNPFGLTHPDSQWKDSDDPVRSKIANIQKELWDWYDRTTTEIGRVDYVVVNGDAIDGKGKKSGGTQLITTDCLEQGDMAYDVISHAKANQYFMTYGTAYHTGEAEDFEKPIADKLRLLNSEKDVPVIWDELRLDVNGVIFDFRHYIDGSASSIVSRNSAILKQQLLEMIRADIAGCQKSDVFIRSHRHQYTDASGIFPNTRVFVTPALKVAGEKYGRVCDGVITVGLILFEVKSKKKWSWKLFEYKMNFVLPEVIKLPKVVNIKC